VAIGLKFVNREAFASPEKQTIFLVLTAVSGTSLARIGPI
jgi:hypothetical protein